ncbi:MAG: DUF4158 domain-containing protein [Ardenticatenaceae bacterium]|nr:DUF4158 domain-containing protein [Ardenticatenaceae bacterium]
MQINAVYLIPKESKKGRYAELPTPDQPGAYFHLTDTDRHLIFNYIEDHTQLGIAVQIGWTRFLGLFLPKSQWWRCRPTRCNSWPRNWH